MERQHLSAEEVIAEAVNLNRLWPKLGQDEKRQIVESIVERITFSKEDGFEMTYCCMPSSEELTKKQRNLSDSSPRSA
jgi:hypothetical protein